MGYTATAAAAVHHPAAAPLLQPAELLPAHLSLIPFTPSRHCSSSHPCAVASTTSLACAGTARGTHGTAQCTTQASLIVHSWRMHAIKWQHRHYLTHPATPYMLRLARSCIAYHTQPRLTPPPSLGLLAPSASHQHGTNTHTPSPKRTHSIICTHWRTQMRTAAPVIIVPAHVCLRTACSHAHDCTPVHNPTPSFPLLCRCHAATSS
jgi:hypothetical protein